MNLSQPAQEESLPAAVAELLITPPALTNQNLNNRIEIHAANRQWQESTVDGLSICILEYRGSDTSKISALLRFDKLKTATLDLAKDDPKHVPQLAGQLAGQLGDQLGGQLGNQTGDRIGNLTGTQVSTQVKHQEVDILVENTEILMQQGILKNDNQVYKQALYLRQPNCQFNEKNSFTLSPNPVTELAAAQQSPVEFYVATGQIAQSDTQERHINFDDPSLWLPGPEEHIDVLPLHMHDGNNSMMVRWQESASFTPKLNPRGEEILVLSGTLSDANGEYEAGSWIRNPISTWQEWKGSPGTVIYYKNGHFDQL